MTDKILILGGTGEARVLAEQLSQMAEVIYSLAGRTGSPKLPAGVTIRQGGFGGAAGLAAYLRSADITEMIDATHPYAAQMAANAAAAARLTGIPHCKVDRPVWPAEDHWVEVKDYGEAVQRLPDLGRRALLTLGADAVEAFRPVADHIAAVRLIVPPKDPPFPVLSARGPFDLDSERKLFADLKVDVLVSKNSGGSATVTKLDVARELGIPVLMIQRPDWPEGVPIFGPRPLGVRCEFSCMFTRS